MLTAVAIAISNPTLLNISTPLILLGVICFVANFVRVARWELLKLDYKPTEADKAKFKQMFPEA